MIALFLLACEFPGVPSTSTDADAADTADTAAPEVDMATCLADGGALVERAASDPWASPLTDLELNDDGQIYVLAEDGHLLLADASDPASWADQHDFGDLDSYDDMLDVSGESMLASFEGVHVGPVAEGADTWSAIEDVGGDCAVSPDGESVAYSLSACGITWGVVDVSSGRRMELDPALGDADIVDVEYLADGRLVTAIRDDDGEGGIAVFDGLTLVSKFGFATPGQIVGSLEKLGDEAATVTLPDRGFVTLERVNLNDGTSTSALLPLRSIAQIAMGPDLTWVLGPDGELVVADGAAVTELGSFTDVVDMVADPAGAWIAMAGADRVLHVYGCE